MSNVVMSAYFFFRTDALAIARDLAPNFEVSDPVQVVPVNGRAWKVAITLSPSLVPASMFPPSALLAQAQQQIMARNGLATVPAQPLEMP